jgi:hypothetical protein
MICSIASDERPGERLLVVLLGGLPLRDPHSPGALTVAPLSIERRYASGWDLLVGRDESALAYDCIVELWNYGRAGRVQLDELFGVLGETALAQLQRMWEAILGSNAEVAPAGVKVGPPIISACDPRLGFQRAEVARAAAFYTPWVEQVIKLSR